MSIDQTIEHTWEPARLIPTSGIGGRDEQERRAASALLAVLGAVREFNRAILKPLGAPAGVLRSYTEVPFELSDGRKLRVDGVIVAERGKKRWVLVVEFKTADGEHTTEQVESYLDIVREQHFDGLLTIGNQIASPTGEHPVKVDGRRYRGAQLYHLSWTRILAMAQLVRDHTGVSDPDQAWILGELIRYLQYPGSGALAFEDMGPDWVSVRESTRNGTIRATDAGVEDVARRWDQLLQFLCLQLGARLGREVHQILSRREQAEPALRTRTLVRNLTDAGTMAGALVIPDAAGILGLSVDLKTMTATASCEVGAPDLKRPTARVNWLLRQLRDAPDSLRLDAAYPRTRSTASELLTVARENPGSLLGNPPRAPKSFRIALTRRVGGKRKSGQGGFITDVIALVENFYGEVMQGLRVWTPPAPQLSTQAAVAADAEDAQAEEGSPEEASDWTGSA